jgi:hypothetical protein
MQDTRLFPAASIRDGGIQPPAPPQAATKMSPFVESVQYVGQATLATQQQPARAGTPFPVVAKASAQPFPKAIPTPASPYPHSLPGTTAHNVQTVSTPATLGRGSAPLFPAANSRK